MTSDSQPSFHSENEPLECFQSITMLQLELEKINKSYYILHLDKSFCLTPGSGLDNTNQATNLIEFPYQAMSHMTFNHLNTRPSF